MFLLRKGDSYEIFNSALPLAQCILLLRMRSSKDERDLASEKEVGGLEGY